jgi:integrase
MRIESMPFLTNDHPMTVPEGKILWDDEITGFGLKHSRGGKKSWVFAYRNPQSRRYRQITIGSAAVIRSASRAREEARKLAETVLLGADPLDVRERERARRQTIGQLIDLYITKHVPSFKPRTQVTVRGYLNNRIRPLFGRFTADELTARVIREGYDRLHELYKPHGARLYIEWFRTMWNWLRKREVVNPVHNPFYGIEWKVRRQPRRRKLSRREYAILWHELLHGEFPGVHWSSPAAIHFILITGVRKRQALGIKKSDIRWKEGRIVLMGKMRAEEDIVITPTLEKFLMGILGRSDSEWLFPMGSDLSRHLQRPDEFWWQLRKRVGLDVTIHDLRRSFISMSRYAGVTLDDASVVIGHADVKITREHYYSLDEEEKAEAASKIAAAIAALAVDDSQMAAVQNHPAGPSSNVSEHDDRTI